MPLEDELSDILKKARNGQQRSVVDVARASGLSETEVAQLERGQSPRSREQVQAVAQALGLMAEPLTQVVDGWTPQAVPPSVPHVETVLGSVGGYEVKGYIVHDGGEAVVIDTAYNASEMLAALAKRKLRLRAICLTHGHSD
nr:helix-turn-helix domain-containing protein [Zoogloea sp.]